MERPVSDFREAFGSLLPPARCLFGSLFNCLFGLPRRRRAGPCGHGRVGRDGSQGSLGHQVWIVRHLGRLFPQLLLFWSVRSHLDLSCGHEAPPSGLPRVYIPSHDGLPLGLAACGRPQGSCLAHLGLVLFGGRGTWFSFPYLELDVLCSALRSSHGDGSHIRRSHLPAAIEKAAGQNAAANEDATKNASQIPHQLRHVAIIRRILCEAFHAGVRDWLRPHVSDHRATSETGPNLSYNII